MIERSGADSIEENWQQRLWRLTLKGVVSITEGIKDKTDETIAFAYHYDTKAFSTKVSLSFKSNYKRAESLWLSYTTSTPLNHGLVWKGPLKII